MSSINWVKRADIAQEQLEAVFWNEEESVYDPFTAYFSVDFNGFHYWWMAHAVDVLLDGYQRSGDRKYLNRMDSLVFGIEKKTNSKLVNEFYDDMEWMALALLRAYSLTNEESYLNLTKVLWDDIIGGLNDHCGGGIAWQKDQLDYKNTPANAPAVILALRLYEVTKDVEYKNHAENIFIWLEKHLVNHRTGYVYDGVNREGNMRIDTEWDFTYNQGVYIGACVEMFKVTKNELYLDKAMKTAEYTFDLFRENDTSVLRSEGDGDSGLFKGIFIRYTEELLLHRFDQVLYDFYIENGNAAWESLEGNKLSLFGSNWLTSNKDEEVTLATHLSGCKLMESINRVNDVHSEVNK